MWRESDMAISSRRLPFDILWLGLAALFACALVRGAEGSDGFSLVEPTSIYAGAFYNGATLNVSGTINEDSQVAIRVTGPLEHHTFNRRGKIGGMIWGGIEHVTFLNTPSLYAVYTSAALAATADPTTRAELRLGYDTLEAHMVVGPTRSNKLDLINNFVRLKESEGLYRIAPGAVHLGDAENGRRQFHASLSIPATAPPGEIEVAVFELAGGLLLRQNTASVKLEHIGLPDFLSRLAHTRGTLSGFLAVLVLVMTGVIMDVLGSWKATGARHPAAVALSGLAKGVRNAFSSVWQPPRSPEEVARLQKKYLLFRRLLALNNEILELLSEVEEESFWTSFQDPRIRMGIRALFDGTTDMVHVLNELTGNKYFDLVNVIAGVRADVSDFLAKAPEQGNPRLTIQLSDISSKTAGQAGGKAVNLARIECDLHLNVPASYVVTSEAYRIFLEIEGLASKLRAVLAPARLDAPEDFKRRCELAQGLVEQTAIPPAIAEAIEAAHRASSIPAGEGMAVRSSASGEDSELSFAGQFETVLNVLPSLLPSAWKKVVMSRFSPRAVFYRRAAGLAEVDTPMAVLVQRMVPARASGVLFTRKPDDPKMPVLLISAVRGLGPDVSAGVASADEFFVSRGSPHHILDRRIARKTQCVVGAVEGGVTQLSVDAQEQLQPSISDAEIISLAEAGLAIERYFGKPQDIEWSMDLSGRIFILQARPLRTEKVETARRDVPASAPLLLRGGQPVWPGRAVGPVHVARNAQEESDTPTGALLVVPQLLPDCVRLIPRVCGIVVERGTVTGHAASIIREFRIPSLFGVPDAVDTLVPGQLVSLDVASRSVFAGALWPELRGYLPVTLLGHRTLGLPPLLAGKLTKLSGSSFMGTWACQSLHDVIRFAHEMAIQSMFDIGDSLYGSAIGEVKRLDSPPHVYVHIVDLGGGISKEAANKRSVKPEEVVSIPFQGLWRGLGDPLFEPQRPDITMRAFGPAFATMQVTGGPRGLGEPNYACITDKYINLNSRQAFHFLMVDSFISDNQNNNHISVRLKGGGAAVWQRELRVRMAAEILQLHHFSVNVTGDLLTGWVRGLDPASGSEKLAMIGHLIRFLSRLDLFMSDETHVKQYADAFVEAEAAALAERGSKQAPVKEARA
jgi:pyruvate,water dikinase